MNIAMMIVEYRHYRGNDVTEKNTNRAKHAVSLFPFSIFNANQEAGRCAKFGMLTQRLVFSRHFPLQKKLFAAFPYHLHNEGALSGVIAFDGGSQ